MIQTTHTLSPEWQNENALRAYPLEDDAPAASVLPTELISDLRVSVSDTYARIFISSAYVSDVLVSVGISGVKYTDATHPENGYAPAVGLLTKTVTRDELEPNSVYSMDVISPYASGVISFGLLPEDTPPIKATFSPDESALVEKAIAYVRRPGVTRIVDRAHGTEASGIIDLSGNAEFHTHRDATDPQTIVVTLTDMYRDLTTSVCNKTPSFSACGETPVKTINGVTPNANGTITLRFR